MPNTATRRTVLAAVPAAAALLAVGHGSAGAALPQQSPVDIDPSRLVVDPSRPPLRLRYRTADLSLSYASSDGLCSVRDEQEVVKASVPDGAGYAMLGRRRFDLKQFHVHTPSEHTLRGEHFPVEQHFVHQASDGALLVVGLWLRADARGGAVDDVLRTLPQECGPVITVPGVDLAALVPQEPTVVRYRGSLTTSPYTEGVLWNVVSRPGRIGAATATALAGLFPDGDSREAQPLDGRSLYLVPGA